MHRFIILAAALTLLLVSTSTAEPFKLQSGETVLDSEYITMNSIRGDKTLALQVKFERGAQEDELRHASIIELLQREVLMKGVNAGFSSVAIWDSKAEVGAKKRGGFFSFGVSSGVWENYDFEIGEQYIWEQLGGPEIDLSKFDVLSQKELGESDVMVSDLYPKSIGSRETDEKYTYYEVWMTVPGATPAEAHDKADELYNNLTGCQTDKDSVSEDSFLGKNEAVALIIYATPYVSTSVLQTQPRLKLRYGHENYELVCRDHSTGERAYDQFQTWQDIFETLDKTK